MFAQGFKMKLLAACLFFIAKAETQVANKDPGVDFYVPPHYGILPNEKFQAKDDHF